MSYHHYPSLLDKLYYRFGATNYVDNIAPYFNDVKDDITLNADSPYDFIHIFIRNHDELEKSATFAVSKLAKNGTLWISWPKNTSNMRASDFNDKDIQHFGKTLGLTDIESLSINEDWMGFKFAWH